MMEAVFCVISVLGGKNSPQRGRERRVYAEKIFTQWTMRSPFAALRVFSLRSLREKHKKIPPLEAVSFSFMGNTLYKA